MRRCSGVRVRAHLERPDGVLERVGVVDVLLLAAAQVVRRARAVAVLDVDLQLVVVLELALGLGERVVVVKRRDALAARKLGEQRTRVELLERERHGLSNVLHVRGWVG